MDQPFLNLTSATWNILFLVIRYVLVALLLAYLTNVFVKRKDVVTDIKGSVLEWRVDTYKNIHRWVMDMKRVIAPPSQQENWFRRRNQGGRNFYTQYIPSHLLKQIA